MKAIIKLSFIAILAITFASCTKEDLAEEANISFKFDHEVDESRMEANTPFTYINKAGNRYNVSELKYTISNMVLIDEGDNEVTLASATNIDAFGGNQLGPITLPNGTYKTMRFTISGFKHIGKFLDGSSTEKNISIDFTGSSDAEIVEIPVGGLTVNGLAKTAYVTFNLNSAYSATTDFNDGASAADVSPNFSGAFTFSGSF